MKINKVKFLVILIILFFLELNKVIAQNIIIKSKIVDEKTLEALPQANIKIENTTFGCVSNDEGDFKLIVPKKYIDSTLIISHIGYKNYSEKIKNINEKETVILLKSIYFELPSVTVLPPDPIDIITQVVLNMKQNYWKNPINSDAFYREILFENNLAKRLSEVACEFYIDSYRTKYDTKASVKQIVSGIDYSNLDRGYSLIDFPQTRPLTNQVIIKEVRTSDDRSNTKTNFYLSGGPMGLLSQDVINYKYTYFLENQNNDYKKTYSALKKKYKNFNIEYSEINNKKVYIFKRNYGDGSKWILYIDEKSKAIIKYDILLIHNVIEEIMPINKKAEKRKTEFEKIVKDSTLFSIQYTEYQGEYYYSSISQKSYFTYIPLYGNAVSLRAEREMMFNSIQTENAKILDKEKTFTNNMYASIYDYPVNYNENFWENYNMLYPTTLQLQIKENLELYKPLEEQFKTRYEYDISLKPPIATKKPDFLTINNDIFEDNYTWLQHGNEQEIKAYIEKENDYSDNYFAKYLKETREFFSEINNRFQSEKIKLDTSNTNIVKGYNYFIDNELSVDGVFCRTSVNNPKGKEIIVDFGEKLKNFPKYSFLHYSFNCDSTILCYYECLYGDDNYFNIQTIFIDLQTLQKIDSIPYISAAWIDNSTICYTKRIDDDYFPRQCFYKKLGINNENLLFEAEKNEILNVVQSKSCKYTFLTTETADKQSRIFYIDNQKSSISLKPIIEKRSDYQYFIDHNQDDDGFYILSNDQATNFELYYAEKHHLERENWKTLIPSQSFEIQWFDLMKNYIILGTRNALNRDIMIFDINSKTIKKIYMPEKDIYYSTEIEKIKNDIITIKYSTYLSPTKYYNYSVKNGDIKLIGEDNINNYNASNYELEVKYVKSEDGLEIPLVLLFHKKTNKKSSPVFIETYGSGGMYFAPKFNRIYLPLLDRGFIVAFAIVCGGGELGYESRKNTKNNATLNLADFIACINYLLDNKITTPNKLFAYGKSYGGYLMTNIANNYPEFFNGIIADLPYCDILTDLADTSSSDNYYHHNDFGYPYIAEEYEILKKIDPYQNIKEQTYPNMLFFGAWQDINVKPAASMKYVAKLRSLKTDNNTLLLRVLMNSGHNEDDEKYYQKFAWIYTFLFDCLRSF